MANSDGILHACELDGLGKGTELEPDRISQAVKSETLTWTHLDANEPGVRSWLEKEVDYLDPIILDALLIEETRPRILQFEEGVLLILRGVNLNENAEPEDMVSIRLWIDSNRIISIRRRPLKAATDILDRLLAGKGPKSSSEFLSMLGGRLFERMEPVFSELDERLDSVEESVMDSPDTKDRHRITSIRKQAILFKRYIMPQRDVVATLRSSDLNWLDTTNKRKLQESLDRLIRYIEDLDTIRERAQIVKDELANALSDRMNKNLYVLSVIAAIFLPLGFLTGLFGVNLGGIPGIDAENAFWVFSGVLLAVTAIQVVLFKFLKWF